MKLRRLAIQRLPGIDESYTLENLGDGFHVIVGPNAIGKSSLCRALRALLWSGRSQREVTAAAVFEADDGTWGVARDGSLHTWQHEGAESDAPAIPAEHLSSSYFLGLGDLLDSSDKVGGDVAKEIRRQMSGGFDLERVVDEFDRAAPMRAGKKARNELTKKEGDVRKADALHGGIASRESKLDGLSVQILSAENAQRRITFVTSAQDLSVARNQLSEAEQSLQLLPSALEHMTGKELDEVNTRGGELESKTSARDAAAKSRDAAIGAADATRLEEPIERDVLETTRERVEELKDIEDSLLEARQNLRGKQSATAAANEHRGSHPALPAARELPGRDALFSLLDDFQKLAHEQGAIDARLKLLASVSPSAGGSDELDRIERGANALRGWLRAPDPEQAQARVEQWPTHRVLYMAAAALLVVGLALGAFVPELFVVAGIGVGVGIVAKLVRMVRGRETPTTNARTLAQSDFPPGLDAPAAWSPEPVTQRLHELEGHLAERKAAAVRERDRHVEKEDLISRRQTTSGDESALEASRSDLAEKLGIDEQLSDAKLVDLARALDDLRIAHVQEQEAIGCEQELAEQCERLLEQISPTLTDYGEQAPTDSASARAGIQSLHRRNDSLLAAHADSRNADDRLSELDAEIDRIGAIKTSIYETAGLDADDLAGLTMLLGEFDRYKGLRALRSSLSATVETATARLVQAGEGSLCEQDGAQLDKERKALESSAEGLKKLLEEVAVIRQEVQSARRGHSVEDAIVAREQALDRLQECRDKVVRAGAGEFLMRTIQTQHETHQMPRVLQRARELFGAFTHQDYELRVSPSDETSFIAVETRSRAGRSPNELSDGTRSQLILAVHLAFTEEAEQGRTLPVFLDEALTHSDPLRFSAVVRSLGRMVADKGRQIFYMTTDPVDVERIQAALRAEGCGEADTIDLSEIRGRATSITDAGQLHVEPLPAVVSPAEMTAEQYGVALAVPAFDPLRKHLTQHLLYLLWDALPVLHRLLQSQIQLVGPWLALSKNAAKLATDIQAAGGAGAQLDARAELLSAFLRIWGEGRGCLIDRTAIEDSGAISPMFLDRVVQIAGEHGGDPEQLLQTLEARTDERLRGFHRTNTSKLRIFLEESSDVDSRPILDERELLPRVFATPAANQLPEGVVAACVHYWWVLASRANSG